MPGELRIAIVGCGQIADAHVSEVQKIRGARVVAVCDAEPLMAEQLAVRMGVPAWYADFAALLDRERPDVVHVCTPPQSHLALARAAIDAGCHVLVEKPFALDHGESRALIEHADRADRRITIGHTYQFDAPAEDLRRQVAAGALGDIVHVDSWFGYDLGGPFGKVILGSADHWVHRLPGKLFQNNINHLLHKITEFMDDERPDIRAMAWRGRAGAFGDARDDMLDELRVMIRGERVSAYATFTSAARPVQSFARYYGTRGTAHVDYGARTVTVQRGRSLPSSLGRLAEGFGHTWRYARASAVNVGRFAASDFHFFGGLGALLRKFYANVRGEAPPPIPARDILRIAWMMDEIFRQVGRPAGAEGRA